MLESGANRRSTLPAIVARGQAGFFAEELCEMAGVDLIVESANITADIEMIGIHQINEAYSGHA